MQTQWPWDSLKLQVCDSGQGVPCGVESRENTVLISFLILRRLANPCLALPLLADSEGSVILGRRLYLDSIPREFQKYYSGSLFIHSVIHLIDFGGGVFFIYLFIYFFKLDAHQQTNG